LVVGVHPWVSPILQPNCLRYNHCKFPRYEKCPISNEFPHLRNDAGKSVMEMFNSLDDDLDFQPDPKTDYGEKKDG